jgi:hypothetical protein
MTDTQGSIVPLDFNAYGDMEDDEEAADFEETLMEQFAASNEGEALLAQGADLGWAAMMMSVARHYEGYPLTRITPAVLRLVLVGTFPRKVSCEAETSRDIVRELRAFYAFLHRAHALPYAEPCLAALDDELTQAMEEEMADPANFGMAKAFVMGTGLMRSNPFATPARSVSIRAQRLLGVGTGLPAAETPNARTPLTRAERNKKKAQRRAERDARRKGR